MDHTSRRGFLGTAGVAAAIGVATVAVPASAGAATREDLTMPSGATGPMAAYIHDLAKGEVALLVEGREVIVTDRPLVARLARAFAKADKS
jgi:hypothetical protein